jgi:hypothetical protein
MCLRFCSPASESSPAAGYRTGIRYLFKEEQKWSPNVIRSDDVETWENMMADFFKSLDKGETKLKRDGKPTTKTGGDKFPLKLLGDTTMKLWDAGNFMGGLQHLLLFNTCGRTGAVSHVNTRHIVAVDDHIASTFPFTKGDQTGEAGGYMLWCGFPWGRTVISLHRLSRAPSSSKRESCVLSGHACSNTWKVNLTSVCLRGVQSVPWPELRWRRCAACLHFKKRRLAWSQKT